MRVRGHSAGVSDDLRASTLRRVDLRLRIALLRLGPNVSIRDLQVAQRTMGEAERALGELADDPWERSVALRAREVLGSHLLAAEACEGAEVGAEVTADVLRRGAHSAQRLIAGDSHHPEVFEAIH